MIGNNHICSQGMQALLDVVFAVEGSVAEAAKFLGYMTYCPMTILHFILYYKNSISI